MVLPWGNFANYPWWLNEADTDYDAVSDITTAHMRDEPDSDIDINDEEMMHIALEDVNVAMEMLSDDGYDDDPYIMFDEDRDNHWPLTLCDNIQMRFVYDVF